MNFANIIQFAKMLNYLQLRTACDAAFGVFLVVWFITRHIFYLIVWHSVLYDLPKIIQSGCYDTVTGTQVSTNGGSAVLANVLQPFNDPQGLVCWNGNIHFGFLSLLLALEILTIIWFVMILRVAYMVISGKNAQEIRSEDEASDVEEEYVSEDEFDAKATLPVTQPTEKVNEILSATKNEHQIIESADELDAVNKNTSRPSSPAASASGRTRRTRGAARTSAISIPGHGDRKELLGRIGCDKPT